MTTALVWLSIGLVASFVWCAFVGAFIRIGSGDE